MWNHGGYIQHHTSNLKQCHTHDEKNTSTTGKEFYGHYGVCTELKELYHGILGDFVAVLIIIGFILQVKRAVVFFFFKSQPHNGEG